MKDPCKQCIVLAMCKAKFEHYWNGWGAHVSVIQYFEDNECPIVTDYLDYADQDMINNLRATYNLDPV